MQNGVVAIRRDGSVPVINDYAYRTLGLTPNSRHMGRHFSDVPGSTHRFSQVFKTAFELAYFPNRCELRLGETDQVFGYTLSRIVDRAETVTGAVLYFKDPTRVEQFEERERLRHRLAALGEMAAAIAHEVKNPLGGIQVMAGLLKRQSSMSDDDLDDSSRHHQRGAGCQQDHGRHSRVRSTDQPADRAGLDFRCAS
jgi:two-component system sensor histidine kinase AtoS